MVIFTMKFRPRHSFSPFTIVIRCFFSLSLSLLVLFTLLIYISMIWARHEREFSTLWSLVRVEFPPFISLHCAIQFFEMLFCRIWYFPLSKSWSKPNAKKRLCVSVVRIACAFSFCENSRLSYKTQIGMGEITAIVCPSQAQEKTSGNAMNSSV